MIQLDYEPSNGNYIIRAPREDADKMVSEFGLDFWPGVSTADTGVFSTIQPYAAAPFWEFANERARAEPTLAHIASEIEASRALDGGHYDVPAGRELSGYQKADLAYMLRRAGGVLDADEPGLGKTPTSIVFANELRARRVLICCPAQIRYQWLERWSEWTTMDRYLRRKPTGYAIVSSRYGVDPDADVTVVSHTLAGAEGVWDALMQQEFDLLILDEAHYLKTPSAERTRAIFGGRHYKKREDGSRYLARDFGGGLVSRAKKVIELTGTPLPNRPAEAYVHARYLCHEAIDFMSEHAFKDRFNPIERKEVRVREIDDVSGMEVWRTKWYTDEKSGRHAELQARLRAHFMCRHLKREVLTQLKLPVYDLVRAEKTALVRAALKAESLLGIDPDDLSGAFADVMGHIAQARHQMGMALVPQAVQYAKMLLNSGVDKLVIFFWHTDVGNALQKGLHDYGTCRIDGGTAPKAKEAQKQRFIRDPDYRVMIGNLLSLGTGTDGLQEVSSYAFIAEPDWVPGVNIQCVDRLDRRGQTQTVNADILVAPGSVAERVLAAALRKGHVIHNTLDRSVA